VKSFRLFNGVLPMVDTISKVKSGGQGVSHWRRTAELWVQIVGGLHVRFMVDERALDQVVLFEFLNFPLLIIISPLLHTQLFSPFKMCASPDQAAHYYEVWGFIFDPTFGW
jgi:hypothetical protein